MVWLSGPHEFRHIPRGSVQLAASSRDLLDRNVKPTGNHNKLFGPHAGKIIDDVLVLELHRQPWGTAMEWTMALELQHEQCQHCKVVTVAAEML